MVAGYDKRGYSIFSVNSEGERLQQKLCSVGSGSLSAYGVLDTYYQPKMTDEEALKLGRRAIMHATYRDSGSGGFCNREFFVCFYLNQCGSSCSYYGDWKDSLPAGGC